MLRESSSQPQPGGGKRQWFSGDAFDLYVWTDGDGGVVRFQLCYGKPRDEHALTWSPKGTSHHRVDDGEDLPTRNRTPILVADGEVAWEPLRRRFEAAAAELDPALRAFVAERIAPTRLVADVDGPHAGPAAPPPRPVGEATGEEPGPDAVSRVVLALLGGALLACVVAVLVRDQPEPGHAQIVRPPAAEPPPTLAFSSCPERASAAPPGAACFAEPRVRAYLDSVRVAIFGAWELPADARPDQSFSLKIALAPDGSVRCVSELSEADPSLAGSVYLAIAGSQPFAPMPEEVGCLAHQSLTMTFRNPVKR
jgi:hypothetical protein